MKKSASVAISIVLLIATIFSAFTAYAEDGGTAANKYSISDCQITLQYTRVAYNGSSRQPSVKVRHNGAALVKDRDYTVTYSSNKKCGTAKVKIAGKGSYTGSATRSFKIVPKKVSGFTSSRTTTSVTVKWKKSAGAVGYKVYKSASVNGKYSKVKTVTGTSAKISGLKAGTKYYFKVVAFGKKDGSYVSEMSNVFHSGTSPNKVTLKKVTKSGSKLNIKWGKVTCSGYEIQYSTDKKMKKNVKTVKIKSSSTTTKTIKNIKKGSTYYVRVRAVLNLPTKTYRGKYSSKLSTNYSHLYASYSSRYVNNANRTTNLRLASQAIDGTIVEPGQTFSFNNVVGKRTAAKGYKSAPVFVGSTTTGGIGGGICQVASTMFNTALLANVSIQERYQHSQRVTYVPLGRDAAIQWGSVDFKWKNNTSTPIKIKMSVKDGTISCKFYTCVNVNPKKVKLSVTQSGKNFTLRRTVSGKVNYTAYSNY